MDTNVFVLDCGLSNFGEKKMRENRKNTLRETRRKRDSRGVRNSLARRVYFGRSVSFLQNCHSVFVRQVTSGGSNHEVFK